MASSMAAKFSHTSTGSKSRKVRRSVKMPRPRRELARQLGERLAQRCLGRVEAADGLAAAGDVARVHAGGDVDDGEHVVGVAREIDARNGEGEHGQRQGAGDEPGARIPEGRPAHGSPFGTPGRSVHSFSGVCSGFSSSSPTACGRSRTRRMAMSRLYLASQLTGIEPQRGAVLRLRQRDERDGLVVVALADGRDGSTHAGVGHIVEHAHADAGVGAHGRLIEERLRVLDAVALQEEGGARFEQRRGRVWPHRRRHSVRRAADRWRYRSGTWR